MGDVPTAAPVSNGFTPALGNCRQVKDSPILRERTKTNRATRRHAFAETGQVMAECEALRSGAKPNDLLHRPDEPFLHDLEDFRIARGGTLTEPMPYALTGSLNSSTLLREALWRQMENGSR
jgi:hypothetical protein